jgi:hypothetical protein
MAFLAAIPAALGTAMGASAATATLAGVTAISAGVGGLGAIMSARAASAQAQSQAQAQDYNAIIAKQNADSALAAASANEDAQRRKSAHEMGRLRAGLAENGIGLDSGTAGDLTAESAMNAELDALNIRYAGQQQARGYSAQAALDTASAAQSRANAKSAMTAGYLTAGASALSAYGSYVGGKSRIQSPGVIS